MIANEKENIYTDEVDYANSFNNSVWGTEEEITKNLLSKECIVGKWLNLCAGDGRFNTQLLEKVSEVIAVDIDENALQKLERITPITLKRKLVISVANIVKPFSFENNVFDGVFCVGTLHLFPESIFNNIFSEMDRVLKPGGRIIIDFATDIKRTYPDGGLWVIENEPNYSLNEALIFLKAIFKDYKINIITDTIKPEEVNLGDKKYIFTSNFILLEAVKQNY